MTSDARPLARPGQPEQEVLPVDVKVHLQRHGMIWHGVAWARIISRSSEPRGQVLGSKDIPALDKWGNEVAVSEVIRQLMA